MTAPDTGAVTIATELGKLVCMFIEAVLHQTRRLTRQLIWIGIACTSMSNTASATLILDPVVDAPMPGGNTSVSSPTSAGFLPIVFQPVTDSSVQAISWRLKSKSKTQAKALHWHIQNAMPWSVSINLTLADASGSTLTTRVALPPGPPQTIVIPLQSVEPITMGMRASPPQVHYVGGEPLLVATSVQGALQGSLQTLSISMPTPDADQTVLLGKLFSPPEQDALKSLYTNLIDCFGQFTRQEWPGKRDDQCEPREATKTRLPVRSVADSSSTGSTAQQSNTATDRFGGLLIAGWPASDLASGAFRTYRAPDRSSGEPGRWILLSPLGNPFFSLGVNAVQLNNSETFVEGREYMFSALPNEQSPLASFYGKRDSTDVLPADAGAQQGRRFRSGRTFDFYRANLFRIDGAAYPERWQYRTGQRLRQWSFNTVAAWTDETFTQSTDLAYTAIIHVGGPFQRLSDGHNWWQGIPDPFDPAFKTSLKTTFAKVVPAHRHNEHLIGYFVDNELAWGDGSADDPSSRYGPVLSALAMNTNDRDAYAKRAFVQYLKSQYADIAELAKAWQLPIKSWHHLDAPMLIDRAALRSNLKSNSALASDMSDLLTLHARKYYELVAETLRFFDPEHLYLGSRFASRTPEAVSACVQFCDLVSFNLYVPDINSGFEAEAFARHDKPAMLTEFHFGSADRGPFWDGVMSVAREQDRGPAYKNMLNSVLANRQFVGAHWFQYLDQPATGRWLDGENGHLGLVSITDTPWYEFTATVSDTNKAALNQIVEQLHEPTR